MPARPALSIGLYLGGSKVLLVGFGPGSDDRVQRLEAAGAQLRQVGEAEFHPDMCEGVRLVLFHCESTPQTLALARSLHERRENGALRLLPGQNLWIYAHDCPEVSDFSLPAEARRGPLRVHIATDGVAPALAARLRRELSRLLDSAGDSLDGLLTQLAELRERLPPGPERARRLRSVAARLTLRGTLAIEAEEVGEDVTK